MASKGTPAIGYTGKGSGDGTSTAVSVLEDRSLAGMRDFLRTLSTQDLFSIAKTTTGGLIAPASSEDAILIITKYSDGVSLLNRRRIKREDMAKYLHSENVKIQLPADKTKLCRYVLNHWGLSDSQTQNYNFQEETTASPAPMTRNKEQNTRSQDNQSNRGTHSAFEATSNMEYEEPMAMDATFSTLPRQQTGQELAELFAPWFYNKWNNLDDFEPRHFWPQCNLRVEVIQPGTETTVKEIYQNGPECCQFLRLLIQTEELWMNPNLLDGLGVWGKINPHGLAQVIVCGTVHKNKRHFGIFEQVFGLVKDPNSENNFKIQFSVIRFRGAGGMLEYTMNTQPTIRDSSLACMIEEISDE